MRKCYFWSAFAYISGNQFVSDRRGIFFGYNQDICIFSGIKKSDLCIFSGIIKSDLCIFSGSVKSDLCIFSGILKFKLKKQNFYDIIKYIFLKFFLFLCPLFKTSYDYINEVLQNTY